MDDIKLFAKKVKGIGNPKTSSENIPSENRDGIGHGKMCHTNNKKQEMTYDRRKRTTKSRKIRTLREQETYKYLGILEADIITKQRHKNQSHQSENR